MNTKKMYIKIALIFTLAISMSALTAPAFANEEVREGFQEFDSKADVEYLRQYPAVEMKVEPSFTFDRADHVANGVAMRNRTSGTVHLRGVPVGSKVIKALLYWNFLDGNRLGLDKMPVLFNGNRVNAMKTADTRDPCWGNVIASHSYRADVTSFVNMSGHPNQDYEVVLLFNESTSTTGQNPWGSYESQNIRTEGATLVVVYRSPNSSGGPLFIYDNLYNALFYSSAAFYLYHGPVSSSSGLFTMAGADGQRGWGHNNFATGEKTFFNGIQIAGSPITSSDWDGSDGWPLPQLWDTHTHVVKPKGDFAKVEYVLTGDCIIPVVFVIDY